MGTEEPRHVADKVLEVGIVVGPRERHLDHMEQIAWHGRPPRETMLRAQGAHGNERAEGARSIRRFDRVRYRS